MAFPRDSEYHADSDADDEYERSVMTSPTQLHTDSETSSDPPSAEHTPTTFEHPGDDGELPRTIITEWTPEECAQFIATLNLRQYCEAFIEHGIVGEALIALKHNELKEMGIASVGHRLTILKHVYDIKVNQDVPIEPDDYVPLSAEQNPQHEMATKEDIARLANSIIRLRDERLAQAESQLTKLSDEYRRLRIELLPVFKMSKERSEPLPYAPYQTSAASPDYQDNMVSPPLSMAQSIPEKTSLTRTFSKKLGLSSSTPKNNSPTHLPTTIHEGRSFMDNSSSLNPSAAANAASNQLTASMSGGPVSHLSTSPGNMPSPTSPMPYHQPLAPRSYQRAESMTLPRYDGTDDARNYSSSNILTNHDPPKSAGVSKNTNSSLSTASTLVPPREHSASVPPHIGRTDISRSGSTAKESQEAEDPSVQIFKSFRVALDDPCYKVLPAALRKYNIQADWRQYALYIVYGDQERCVGLDEKPLALFKDLDREGKKPMFMLRKLANGIVGDVFPSGAPRPGLSGGGLVSSAASVRAVQPGNALPGGVL